MVLYVPTWKVSEDGTVGLHPIMSANLFQVAIYLQCLLQDANSPSPVLNKHLMTGPKKKNKTAPSNLNVSLGFASGNIEVSGKQNSLFPEGPAIKCFVIPPGSKLEKNCEKLIYCDWACSTSGSQTELSHRNETITVFCFGANKE